MKPFKQLTLVLLLVISISLAFQTSAFAVPKAVKAKSEYMLAERMYNEGKFKDCIKHAVIAKDTLGKSNSRIEYILTKAYFKNNQLDKAMTSVDLFFEITPESASGTKQYNEMVEVYSKIEFEKAQQEKKNAPKYYKQGKVFNEQKNYEQALVYYSKAINADPEYINGYMGRANVYTFRLHKYEQAIQDLDKAMEVNPKFWGTYFELSRIYGEHLDVEHRDTPKAVQLALKAVSLNKNNRTIKRLTIAYKSNKQYDKAIEVQKKEKERHRKKMLAKCPGMHKERIKWLLMLIKNQDDWNARVNKYHPNKSYEKHKKELRELRESISNCQKKYGSTQN